MTKEEFSKLSIENQINFFNEQLASGKNASHINKELGFNESTTRKKFAKNGFKLNPEKTMYINVDDNSHQYAITQKEIDTKPIHSDNVTCSKSSDKNSNTIDDNNNTALITQNNHDNFKNNLLVDELPNSNDLNQKILKLINYFDDIELMINWFKSIDDKCHINLSTFQSNIIIIDLPDQKTKRTSIRINEKIWNEFGEFCESNDHLDKHDIHSMALKEYMLNHKK